MPAEQQLSGARRRETSASPPGSGSPTKRARYAAETAVPVASDPATELAGRMEALQDVLGEHQDSVAARALLLELTVAAHLAGEEEFTYGLLYAHELTLADEARGAYRRALKKASTRKTRRQGQPWARPERAPWGRRSPPGQWRWLDAGRRRGFRRLVGSSSRGYAAAGDGLTPDRALPRVRCAMAPRKASPHTGQGPCNASSRPTEAPLRGRPRAVHRGRIATSPQNVPTTAHRRPLRTNAPLTPRAVLNCRPLRLATSGRFSPGRHLDSLPW